MDKIINQCWAEAAKSLAELTTFCPPKDRWLGPNPVVRIGAQEPERAKLLCKVEHFDPRQREAFLLSTHPPTLQSPAGDTRSVHTHSPPACHPT